MTNEVSFQTAELGKVDQGGGGTIAYILGKLWNECHRQRCSGIEYACAMGDHQ